MVDGGDELLDGGGEPDTHDTSVMTVSRFVRRLVVQDLVGGDPMIAEVQHADGTGISWLALS